MHHVTPELLAWAFHQLKARAAPGVDGVTWEEYAGALDGNIDDLHRRVMRGGAGRNRRGGSTSRRPTAGNGRSASQHSRTRSSNGRWWRC